MNRIYRVHVISSSFCWIVLAGISAAPAAEIDAAKIEAITGAKPAFNKAENVLKVSFPRNDVKVTVDGNPMPPFMGLTSWAAFMPGTKTEAMVMGDVVLFQDEVNRAMDVAFANGLSVTALHNHFFYEEPRVFFMHIGGEGTTDQLSTGVRKMLDKVKEIRGASPHPGSTFGTDILPEKSSITVAPLLEVFGGKPAEKDGMVKFVVGRTTKMPCGCEVGKEMGVNTWAAFMGSDERAVVDGDFVTFEGELQPVLKSLRSSGINIVAIHSHMEGDNPKAIFLHYWGIGSASELAKGVKAAIDIKAK